MNNDVLKNLVTAIDNNTDRLIFKQDGELYVKLQYIADELEEAKSLIKK